MRKLLLILSAVTLGCVLVSCGTAKTEPAAAPAPGEYNTVATIKDIMGLIIDPSADFIWASIGTEVSAKGIVEKQPRNAEEWAEERRHAMILVEAANLLTMPGRRVAQEGEKSENPDIELNPDEIQALIDKDRATFNKLAAEFQQTALEQLKAVDDKNIPELLRTGGDLDTRCENCHKVYWYPNDPAYKNLPTEGGAEKK
jgi:hypothetical protein